MKLKHTPGPWMYMHEIQKIDEKLELHFHTVRTGDKNIVRVPDEANARLIAAAPDMLEALMSIQSGMLPYEDESGVIKVSLHKWRDLKSIIKAATGQSIDDIMKEERDE